MSGNRRAVVIRLTRTIAAERGLTWPDCFADETLSADVLRLELRRRLRKTMPDTNAAEREALIEELS